MEKAIWTWEVTRGICLADGAEKVPVYGIRARQDGRVVWAFEDVDTCQQTVEELAARLREASPEPCHLAEIVEDYIAGQVSR